MVVIRGAIARVTGGGMLSPGWTGDGMEGTYCPFLGSRLPPMVSERERGSRGV